MNEYLSFYKDCEAFFESDLGYSPFREAPKKIVVRQKSEKTIKKYRGGAKWQDTGQTITLLINCSRDYIKPIISRECLLSFFSAILRENPLINAFIYRRLIFGDGPFDQSYRKRMKSIFSHIYDNLISECMDDDLLLQNIQFLEMRLPLKSINKTFCTYAFGLANISKYLKRDESRFLDLFLDDYYYQMSYDLPLKRNELDLILDLAEIFQNGKLPIDKMEILNSHQQLTKNFMKNFHEYFSKLEKRGISYSYKINYRALGLDYFSLFLRFNSDMNTDAIDKWLNSSSIVFSYRNNFVDNTVFKFAFIIYSDFDELYSFFYRLKKKGYLREFLLLRNSHYSLNIQKSKHNFFFNDYDYQKIIEKAELFSFNYDYEAVDFEIDLDYLDYIIIEISSFSGGLGFGLNPKEKLIRRLTRKMRSEINLLINLLHKFQKTNNDEEKEEDIKRNIAILRKNLSLPVEKLYEVLLIRVSRLCDSEIIHPCLINSFVMPDYHNFQYLLVRGCQDVEKVKSDLLRLFPYSVLLKGIDIDGDVWIFLRIRSNSKFKKIIEEFTEIYFASDIVFLTSFFGFRYPAFNLVKMLSQYRYHEKIDLDLEFESITNNSNTRILKSYEQPKIFKKKEKIAKRDNFFYKRSLLKRYNAELLGDVRRIDQLLEHFPEITSDILSIGASLWENLMPSSFKEFPSHLIGRLSLIPNYENFGFTYYLAFFTRRKKEFHVKNKGKFNTMGYLISPGCFKVESNRLSRKSESFMMHYLFPMDDFADNLFNYASRRNLISHLWVFRMKRLHFSFRPEYMISLDGWKSSYSTLNFFIEKLLETEDQESSENCLEYDLFSKNAIQIKVGSNLFNYTAQLWNKNIKKMINLRNQSSLYALIQSKNAFIFPELKVKEMGLSLKVRIVFTGLDKDGKNKLLRIVKILPYSIIYEATNYVNDKSDKDYSLIIDTYLPNSRIGQFVGIFDRLSKLFTADDFFVFRDYDSLKIRECTDNKIRKIPNAFKSNIWDQKRRRFFRKRLFDEKGRPLTNKERRSEYNKRNKEQ